MIKAILVGMTMLAVFLTGPEGLTEEGKGRHTKMAESKAAGPPPQLAALKPGNRTTEMKVRLVKKDSQREVYLKAADPYRSLPHLQGPLPMATQLHPGNASQKGIELSFGLR